MQERRLRAAPEDSGSAGAPAAPTSRARRSSVSLATRSVPRHGTRRPRYLRQAGRRTIDTILVWRRGRVAPGGAPRTRAAARDPGHPRAGDRRYDSSCGSRSSHSGDTTTPWPSCAKPKAWRPGSAIRARLGRVLADICARLRNVAGEHLQAIEVGRARPGDRAPRVAIASSSSRPSTAPVRPTSPSATIARRFDFLSRCADERRVRAAAIVSALRLVVTHLARSDPLEPGAIRRGEVACRGGTPDRGRRRPPIHPCRGPDGRRAACPSPRVISIAAIEALERARAVVRAVEPPALGGPRSSRTRLRALRAPARGSRACSRRWRATQRR